MKTRMKIYNVFVSSLILAHSLVASSQNPITFAQANDPMINVWITELIGQPLTELEAERIGASLRKTDLTSYDQFIAENRATALLMNLSKARDHLRVILRCESERSTNPRACFEFLAGGELYLHVQVTQTRSQSRRGEGSVRAELKESEVLRSDTYELHRRLLSDRIGILENEFQLRTEDFPASAEGLRNVAHLIQILESRLVPPARRETRYYRSGEGPNGRTTLSVRP